MVIRLIRLLACAGLLLSGPGCGYHLRGDLPGSIKDRTLMITGIGKSNPLYGNFVADLTARGGKLATRSKDAGAIVNVMRANHIRRPITLSSAGRANMFDLTFRVVYEVQDPEGGILIPEKELMVRREYFNTQGSPLGQGLEEAQMRTEMEREAAQTLLRQVIFTLNDRTAHPS